MTKNNCNDELVCLKNNMKKKFVKSIRDMVYKLNESDSEAELFTKETSFSKAPLFTKETSFPDSESDLKN